MRGSTIRPLKLPTSKSPSRSAQPTVRRCYIRYPRGQFSNGPLHPLVRKTVNMALAIRIMVVLDFYTIQIYLDNVSREEVYGDIRSRRSG